jgi:predicted nucleic acid-binding protein
VNAGASLPAHAAFETYSVLTRLPEPHRASAVRVHEFVDVAFGSAWIALAGEDQAKLLRELVERGIRGGAAYDALIGATARSAGALLYTCDLRARATYDLLGVEVGFIG